MTDETRALLGDHEAAKRLTDAGVLVPCAHCGNDDDYRIVMSFKKDKKKRFGAVSYTHLTLPTKLEV